MQTKTWKWLAPAAAAAIGGILLLWPGASGNGKAYGMSDVPSLLRSSRILHIQGWGYDPTTAAHGKEPRRGPFEWWLDLENGRMHLSQPNRPAVTGEAAPGEEPPLLARTLDGQYRMEEVFTRHVGGGYTMGVQYQRMTPFLARLEVHEMVQTFLVQLFGKADLHEGFQKVGQEAIDGTRYDIWQGEADMGGGYQIKFRSWLCPRTGDLGRVHAWIKMPDKQTDWIPVWDLEKIERNVPAPDGLFSTEPPKGYTLHNTKETAPQTELPVRITNGWPDHTLRLHMAFTLQDGTVILGWSVTGKAISCPQETYAGLTPGGPLPDLPHKITTVEPMPDRAGVQYIPRHLAFTVRDSVYYEWSLHVPVGTVVPRSSFLMYRLAEKERPGWGQMTGNDLEVNSPKDFNTWVRGAMAEFSDGGAAPDQITYEYIMGLSRQIRASAPAEAAATQPAVSASAGK